MNTQNRNKILSLYNITISKLNISAITIYTIVNCTCEMVFILHAMPQCAQ